MSRDRIKELRRVRAGDLRANPRNWRTHPEAQRSALAAVLEEVGYADALLARETSDGLELIDGHLRADLTPDQEVPVLVVDLNDEEAALVLATLDPLAAQAVADQQKLAELLASIETDQAELQKMLDELAEQEGLTTDAVTEDSEPLLVRAASLADLAPDATERADLAGRRILVEFSGGIDSGAAALWCRHYLPESELELVFVEMGADFTGFHLFLVQFAEWLGKPLVILRTPQSMLEVFLAKGCWPHFRHPYCHEVLHAALDDHVRQSPPEEIVIVRGGRRREKAHHAKANPDRWLTVSRMADYRYFQPLYFSDKDSSERIQSEAGAPIWEGYATGLCRTACRICPGQRPVAYAAMRRHWPHVWQELLTLEAKFGVGCWNTPGASFAELADKADAKQEQQ